MSRLWMAALALVASTAAPAGAAEIITVAHNFELKGSMPDHGKAGNKLTFRAKADPTLQLIVSGWQSSQQTNRITAAYVGAYSGGLGVTGTRDSNGAGARHQIDNVDGYTDFVLLQFSRAVVMSNVFLNLYQMSGVKVSGVNGRDGDFAMWNASALPLQTWDQAIDLSGYRTDASLWTAFGGVNGLNAAGMPTASDRWLLSASFLPGDRDDGFKLFELNATEIMTAVPEPGTWGMMLVGLGVTGAMLRRRRRAAWRGAVAV